MWKTAIAAAVATASFGQTGPARFEKAPADVTDALTARAREFYQDHVNGKYRLAEALVAEDSKDGFYAAEKPLLTSFTLSDFSYSDHYTKAKITVVGKMMMTFLGVSGPQMMDVPFPSHWKLEGGKWVWYIYKDPNRMTPFGKIAAKPSTESMSADPAQAFASAPDLAAILSGVKADKNAVGLPKAVGSAESVTFVNQLAGKVTLSLDAESYPGLQVKLFPLQLKQGEKAVLTIERAIAKEYVNRVIRVKVLPSTQVLDVMVRFQ